MPKLTQQEPQGQCRAAQVGEKCGVEEQLEAESSKASDSRLGQTQGRMYTL